MGETNKKTENEDKRSDKKALVLGESKSRKTPIILGVVFALVAVGVYATLQRTGGASEIVAADPHQGVFVDQVTYPVDQFADGKARHYDYTDGDFTVRYFVLKSTDGVIRAAFDACDVCWPSGKGYHQEGGKMICRNCGRKFDSVNVNDVQGGCNPAPLKRTVANGKLVIEIADILDGKRYFDFSGRG
jgi:uncharacterized membrane protein